MKNIDFCIAMLLNIPAFFIYSFAGGNFMIYLMGIPLTIISIIFILIHPVEKFQLTKTIDGEQEI